MVSSAPATLLIAEVLRAALIPAIGCGAKLTLTNDSSSATEMLSDGSPCDVNVKLTPRVNRFPRRYLILAPFSGEATARARERASRWQINFVKLAAPFPADETSARYLMRDRGYRTLFFSGSPARQIVRFRED